MALIFAPSSLLKEMDWETTGWLWIGFVCPWGDLTPISTGLSFYLKPFLSISFPREPDHDWDRMFQKRFPLEKPVFLAKDHKNSIEGRWVGDGTRQESGWLWKFGSKACQSFGLLKCLNIVGDVLCHLFPRARFSTRLELSTRVSWLIIWWRRKSMRSSPKGSFRPDSAFWEKAAHSSSRVSCKSISSNTEERWDGCNGINGDFDWII